MGKNRGMGIAGKILAFAGIPVIVLIILASVFAHRNNEVERTEYQNAFLEKEALLHQTVVTPQVEGKLYDAGEETGYVVFFSVGNTAKRAYVYHGKGTTLEDAWQAASNDALDGIEKHMIEPVWVKAEAVCRCEPTTPTQVKKDLANSLDLYYHYGLAFDSRFDFALTELELNSTKIYDYDDNTINFRYLNRYLKETGRKTADGLPEECFRFQTLGWICDETGKAYKLADTGLSYGRRLVDTVDEEYVKQLIKYDLDYLRSALHRDGTFDYAVLPRFDSEIEWYNTARHAGTVWSMVQGYKLWPDPELKSAIDLALEYLLKQIIYNGDAAYVYWENRDDIELGANAIALITLVEYSQTFNDTTYLDTCTALALGILSMQNTEKGTFIHVFNKDFTVAEEFTTVYYEGEATYSLLRLYELTKDTRWYDTAKMHIERFIREDYTKHCDHWISYTFNEITKYDDDPRYYAFGLKNATVNMSYIKNRRTPAPTRLEQLMCTFELYTRAVERGVSTEGFDVKELLNAVVIRMQRALDGRFYPEIAMHMTNPKRIVNSYMMRYLDFRVRIDDIQHNIGGSYLYSKNYQKLVECGMNTSAAAVNQGEQTDAGPEGGDEDGEE